MEFKVGSYIQIPRNQEVRFGGRWGTVKFINANTIVVELNRTSLNPRGKDVSYCRASLEAAFNLSMPSDAQFAAALQPCGK